MRSYRAQLHRDVGLDCRNLVRWEFDDLISDFTKWLTIDDDAPAQTSRVGIMSSIRFQQALEQHVDQTLCANARLLLRMSSLLRNLGTKAYPRYTQAMLEAVRSMAGVGVLNGLEKTLSMAALAKCSKPQLLGLFLILLCAVIAVTYTEEIIRSETIGNFEAARHEMICILTHHMVFIGERAGFLYCDATKERLAGSCHGLWNKAGGFQWVLRPKFRYNCSEWQAQASSTQSDRMTEGPVADQWNTSEYSTPVWDWPDTLDLESEGPIVFCTPVSQDPSHESTAEMRHFEQYPESPRWGLECCLASYLKFFGEGKSRQTAEFWRHQQEIHVQQPAPQLASPPDIPTTSELSLPPLLNLQSIDFVQDINSAIMQTKASTEAQPNERLYLKCQSAVGFLPADADMDLLCTSLQTCSSANPPFLQPNPESAPDTFETATLDKWPSMFETSQTEHTSRQPDVSRKDRLLL